jgi:hypothetical protein
MREKARYSASMLEVRAVVADEVHLHQDCEVPNPSIDIAKPWRREFSRTPSLASMTKRGFCRAAP